MAEIIARWRLTNVRRGAYLCGMGAEKYLTTKQAAERWGVSLSAVQVWCRQGKIRGAILLGRDWTIPADAKPYKYRNPPRQPKEATP